MLYADIIANVHRFYAEQRLADIMRLGGHIRRRRPALQIAQPKRSTERFRVCVPEVDPVTRSSTGRMKEYGYVDLPRDLPRVEVR